MNERNNGGELIDNETAPAAETVTAETPPAPAAEPASEDPEIDKAPEGEGDDPELDAPARSHADYVKATLVQIENGLAPLRRVQRMDITGDMVATAIKNAITAAMTGPPA